MSANPSLAISASAARVRRRSIAPDVLYLPHNTASHMLLLLGALALSAMLATPAMAFVSTEWIPSSTNLELVSWNCPNPAEVAYTESDGVVESHCTIDVAVNGWLPLLWFPGMDVTVSIVAMEPSGLFLTPGIEMDSRRLATTRFGVGFSPGSGTIEVDVPLTDVDEDGLAMSSWLADHHSQGRVFAYRVEVDPDDEIVELGEVTPDNSGESSSLGYFKLSPLTGDIRYGNVVANLHTGSVLAPSIFGAGACTFLQLELGPGAAATWSPGAGFADVELDLEGKCVDEYSATTAGVTLESLHSIPSITVSGHLGGLEAGIVVNLGTTGISAVSGQLVLPDQHTWHSIRSDGRPTPRGARKIEFSSVTFIGAAGFGTSMGQFRGRTGSGFLQPPAMPVALYVRNIIASPAAVRGRHDGTHYAYDLPFAPDDRRRPAAPNKAPRVATNDIRFAVPGATQPTTQFTIRPAGLVTRLGYEAVDGDTHFPFGALSTSSFDVAISAGAIRGGQSAGVDQAFEFTQATSCESCANPGDVDPTHSLTFSGATSFAPDGTAAARVAGWSTPAWGSYDSTDGFIFERAESQDLTGLQNWPGYLATGSGGAADVATVDSLLGARKLSQTGAVLRPTTHYLRGASHAQQGNFSFAGLTVGPYVYRDSAGTPTVGLGADLTGTSTSIRFGGHGQPGACAGGPCEFESNVGTKYVLRPDGITGVFNTDDIASLSELEVYGYDLPLERFAFRLRSNVIDTTTWMDGEVSIPEPGEFTVAFDSLSFDCTGDLGDGLVPPCPAGGEAPTPNCGESLGAWQTNFDPLSIGFVPESSDAVCGGSDRVLQVGHSLDISALDDPLALTATWQATGAPIEAAVSGRTEHVLDRPASPSDPSDDQGLDVVFAGPVDLAYSASVGGSYVAPVTMGAPFWNAFNADVRLAQATPGTAAPTVMVQAGSHSSLDTLDPLDPGIDELMRDPAYALTAHYDWGGTGLSLDFQVGYDGNNAGSSMPQFLGLERSTSLVVLDIGASVDYVTPNATAVSFGASASAEVAAFTDIQLHIDLQDPQSLAEIDDWLNLVGISGTPVTNAVGGLTAKLEAVVDGFTTLQLEAAVEYAVGVAIDVAVSVVPGIPTDYDDAFEYLASLFGEIESIPAHLAVEVSLAFEEITAEIVAGLTAELHATVLDIYVQFGAIIESGACGAPCSALRDDIAAVRGVLADMTAAVDRAEYVLELIPTSLDTVVDAAIDAVDTAQLIVDAVANVTALDASFVGSFEDADISSNVLLIALVAVALPVLEPLVDELKLFEVLDDLADLADLLPLDSLGLGNAESDIRNQALAIADDLAHIGDAFTLHIEGGTYSGSFSAAGAWLVQLSGQLDTARSELLAVSAAFDVPLETLREAIALSRLLIEGADATLAFLDDQLLCLSTPGCVLTIQATVAADVLVEVDVYMSAMTSGVLEFGGVEAFTETLQAYAKLPFDYAIVELLAAANVSLPSLEYFAAFSASATIRATLVDFVMNTEIVAKLVADVQAHFSMLVESAIDLAQLGLGQLDALLREAVASAEAALAAALESASALIEGVVPDLPFTAGRIDGYALISGDELDRLHIGASFTRSADTEEAESSFEASLDVKAWDTDADLTGCVGGAAGALLDATISTTQVPLRLGPSEVTLDTVMLGFTLDGSSFPPSVVGVFGGISTSGGFDFEAFSLFDLGLEMGVGVYETYLGAKGSAEFGSFDLSAAFLLGRTCGADVLDALDPQVAEFITLPGGVFNGVYVRGSASVPVVDFGCLLRLDLLADLGAWVLAGPPLTVGGLVGGGASGKLGCIGALRGQLTLFGEKSGSNVKFKGEGFAAAGVGLSCDPDSWTSISKSRDDDGCATGDASVEGEYSNGKFDISKPNVSAVH